MDNINLILTELRELRQEIKQQRLEISNKLDGHIAGNTKDFDKIEMEVRANFTSTESKLRDLDSRIRVLEFFKYILAAMVFAGVFFGSTLAPYLPGLVIKLIGG